MIGINYYNMDEISLRKISKEKKAKQLGNTN